MMKTTHSDCRNCSDYIENPNRYSQKGLGSKWNNTCIYWDTEQKNIQVVCGCFRGTLEEFKNAVLKKYNKDHEYIKYINITKEVMRMEMENAEK